MRNIFTIISRRHFLSGLLASVGLASIGVSFERQRRKQPLNLDRARVLDKPRYRKEKPIKFFVSTQAPGFYLYKKGKKSTTSVIHVVDAKKRIRGVQKLDEGKLVLLDSFPKGVDPRSHVNRSAAPYVLETAALAEVTALRPEIACQLLWLGINDSLKSLRKTRESLSAPLSVLRRDVRDQFLREKRWLVSSPRKVPVRLFDLLVALSVRYGYRNYLQSLISLVEANPDLSQALKNRLPNWKDSKRLSNHWTKDDIKWNNTELPTRLRAESSKVG